MIKFHQSGKVLFFVLCIICLANTACKKEEIQGPKGETGDPGGGSNSSISTSQVFTIPSTEWKKGADSTSWVTTITSPLITKNVADKGVVKMYMLEGSSWWELPYVVGDLFIQFSFKEGVVNVKHSDTHGSLPEEPELTQYRMVIISDVEK